MARAYSILQGVWYAGMQYRYDNLRCSKYALGVNNMVQIDGDVMPFLLEVGGVVYLACAGQLERHVSAVTVNDRACAVGDGAWLSQPVPMEPGMRLRVRWLGRDGRTVVREIQTDPLEADRLGPIFGPDWTSYAPL